MEHVTTRRLVQKNTLVVPGEVARAGSFPGLPSLSLSLSLPNLKACGHYFATGNLENTSVPFAR